MAYDVSRLSSADSARTYMQNVHARGDMEQYEAAFRRLCELEGRNHDDLLEKDVWTSIAAQEELRRMDLGKQNPSRRIRQKIARVGVLKTVADLMLTAKPSEGFQVLLDRGHPILTLEYIVVSHAHRFTEDVVSSASARLEQAGIALPIKAA